MPWDNRRGPGRQLLGATPSPKGSTEKAARVFQPPAPRRSRAAQRRRRVRCPDSESSGQACPVSSAGAGAPPVPGVRARPGDAAGGVQCPGGGVPQPELRQVPRAEPWQVLPRGRAGRQPGAGGGGTRGKAHRPVHAPPRRAALPLAPRPPSQRRARGACAALRRAAQGPSAKCASFAARAAAVAARDRDGRRTAPSLLGERVPVRERSLLRPCSALPLLRRQVDRVPAVPAPASQPCGGGAARSSSRGRAGAAPRPFQPRGPPQPCCRWEARSRSPAVSAAASGERWTGCGSAATASPPQSVPAATAPSSLPLPSPSAKAPLTATAPLPERPSPATAPRLPERPSPPQLRSLTAAPALRRTARGRRAAPAPLTRC
ncbi:nascent polypeptide-associated complex subunit alpha, muscle-specific form-like [Strigops habroptila]|uniref:nascent polypeptide-associated complex subunit alpha, muscle-specific form-like n=1 Tax=Strigops habroptila TaxID=2489341 RepID=UPI0011CF5673|nr:nascent polypeptide-associated complex subunit alpha, muscle-specific form-like [Strigops habroptila]